MSVVSGSHSRDMHDTGKTALALILLSESVFFATLLAAYAALRSENQWMLPRAPEQLVVPAANTIILLLSVLPAKLAARAAARRTSAELWLAGTFAIGMVFVVGQLFEFARSGMRVDDAAFGGIFFALMGFHGLHVAAGMLCQALNWVRARLGDFASGGADVEIGSMFWYYVVAVWLVLFAALYIL